MLKVAYGHLNLMPNQFWTLLPYEYRLMTEGYKTRQQVEHKKLAVLASWVTAPHLKRPIDPDKLLGKKKDVPKEKKKTNPQETKSVLEGLIRDMNLAKERRKLNGEGG